MKILLSAYACEPNKGSEPGVGWNWALELAKSGHEVWVLTRANNRHNIEKELPNLTSHDNMHFVYYDLPTWAGWWKQGPRLFFVNLYYGLWQWGAYLKAKELLKEHMFDVVHHITFGVFRQPSFMGNLGIPFYFGPVGGGEHAPIPLRRMYSLNGHIRDFARDFLNFISKFDPLLHQTFAQAQKIYVKTHETGALIPEAYQNKVVQHLEIGIRIPQNLIERRSRQDKKPLRLLYVGNFFSLKGLPLAFSALKQVIQIHPETTFTLVGQGPERRYWEGLAQKMGIAPNLQWIHWVRQEALKEIYQSHDVFLFPSLHDSSGNVLLEAMFFGLPIVCFNLGGPGVIVNNSCGRVVPAKDSSMEEAVRFMADAITELIEKPDLRFTLSQGASDRVKGLSWESIVKAVYPEP